MSYIVKEKVVRVDHRDDCSRSKSCGPACVRITDGWRVEFQLMFPNARRPVRKRERIPSGWSDHKARRTNWARQREAYWIARGQKEEQGRANITVKDLAEMWLTQREAEKGEVGPDRQRMVMHVLPVLGSVRVTEVRPRHAHELVMALRRTPSERGGSLASRTIRGIYFLTKQLFHYALLQELIPGNPVTVDRGVLPKKSDKDPGWRKGAVFTKAEVELLISSDKVPLHRRVLYALSFLTGLRPGQVFELRWGDYEPDFGTLGRLSSSRSWDSKRKLVKATKTGVDHLVPVHTVLAKVLAEWKLGGWAVRHGRKPKSKDLIVPTVSLTNRDVRRALNDFREDLDRLDLRHRRQYDARRTFASLAISGGAPRDVVKAITHPRPADVFDLYVTPTWEALSGAVSCIPVSLSTGTVVQLMDVTKSDGTGMAREVS